MSASEAVDLIAPAVRQPQIDGRGDVVRVQSPPAAVTHPAVEVPASASHSAEAAKKNQCVTDPPSVEARLQGAAAQQMAEWRAVNGEPAEEREERADQAVTGSMDFEIR